MDFKRIVAFLLIIVITLGLVSFTSPDLVKKIKLGLDLKGGFEILYKATPIDKNQPLTQESLTETANDLRLRINKQGVSEPSVTVEGKDRIRIQIAGVADENKLRTLLKKPAVLEFRTSDGKVVMRGNDFVPGAAKIDYSNTYAPEVAIQVKDKKKFGDLTTKLVGKQMGIYLDNKLISNPVVKVPILNGNAVISGSKDLNEAQNLRDIINLGALPLNITELYTQSVGATLGTLSLHQTLKAGLIGSIIILLFMLLLYRIPGVVATITLATYTWLLLLVFYFMQATLTLPGIAAFVLGIGMAVDANIITYERIKQELRSGKSMLSSFRAGSKNSFRTIMDANVTTIIAGIVLYFMGAGGETQGFALTLIFSIIVSIITNVLFSRLLLSLLVRSKFISKPSYLGVKEAEISEL